MGSPQRRTASWTARASPREIVAEEPVAGIDEFLGAERARIARISRIGGLDGLREQQPVQRPKAAPRRTRRRTIFNCERMCDPPRTKHGMTVRRVQPSTKSSRHAGRQCGRSAYPVPRLGGSLNSSTLTMSLHCRALSCDLSRGRASRRRRRAQELAGLPPRRRRFAKLSRAIRRQASRSADMTRDALSPRRSAAGPTGIRDRLEGRRLALCERRQPGGFRCAIPVASLRASAGMMRRRRAVAASSTPIRSSMRSGTDASTSSATTPIAAAIPRGRGTRRRRAKRHMGPELEMRPRSVAAHAACCRQRQARRERHVAEGRERAVPIAAALVTVGEGDTRRTR